MATRVTRAPLDSGRWTDIGRLVRGIMPSHAVYCEPWFLEGEVFFQKPPAGVEVINDPNDKVIQFYFEAMNRPEHLRFLMESTLQSDTLLKLADDIAEGRMPADGLGRAWAAWLNYSSRNVCRTAWLTETMGHIQSSDWVRHRGFTLDRAVSERLQGVHIWSRTAREVIQQTDGPDTFFYLHPADWQQLKSVKDLLPYLKGKLALYCPTPKMTVWAMDSDFLFPEFGDKPGCSVWLNYRVTRNLFK